MQNDWELIVFDWDGTLMDSTYKIVSSLQAAMVTVGIEPLPANTIKQIIGLSLENAVSHLLPEQNAQIKQKVVNAYRENFFQPGFAEEKLFSNVVEVLTTLTKKDYYLAIATGKSRRGLDQALMQTELADYFIMTRCADESFSKPHPQMLEDILNFVAVAPNKAVMVGDTTYDLEMAYHAKMAAVAVNYGAHDYNQLSECAFPALAYLDNIIELLKICNH